MHVFLLKRRGYVRRGLVWRGLCPEGVCLEGFCPVGFFLSEGVMSICIGLMTPYASFTYKLPAPNVYFRQRLAEAMITHHISEDIVLSRPSLQLTPMTNPPQLVQCICAVCCLPCHSHMPEPDLSQASDWPGTSVNAWVTWLLTIQQYQMLSDHINESYLGMCQLY